MIAAQKEIAQKEIAEIAKIAKQYLEPHQPDTYRLTVKENGIKKDQDFWYVVVQPSRDDIRSYDIYARLSEAEADIENHENLKILLVPVLSGD